METGTVTHYHTLNEEEVPRRPLSESERATYNDIAAGATCADALTVAAGGRAALRSLLRRGYIGSCSVAGCRVRHYYTWTEDA